MCRRSTTTRGLNTGSREASNGCARRRTAAHSSIARRNPAAIRQEAPGCWFGLEWRGISAEPYGRHRRDHPSRVHASAGVGGACAGEAGPPPPHATPNAAQNRRAVDAYLTIGLDELHPDVTLMWLSDPDTTAHDKGMGAAPTRDALCARRRRDWSHRGHAARERTDRANQRHRHLRPWVLDAYRHVQATGAGRSVCPQPPDGSRDIVVAEGAVYVRSSDADKPGRVAAIVAALQKKPEVGAIFTRPRRARRTGRSGAGHALVRRCALEPCRRAADILVSANWTRDANAGGYRRTDHAERCRWTRDFEPLRRAQHPDRGGAGRFATTRSATFRPERGSGANALHLLGVPVPATMTGRVIAEGLRNGPEISSVRVDHATETVRTSDGAYELIAHFSSAAGHRYLDFTEVKRR